MKTKIILILSALLLIVSTATYVAFSAYKHQKAEADRQSKNVSVLNKNFVSYKNALGQQVAVVEALNYTISELKENETDLYNRLKASDIIPKQVKSITQVSTSSHIEFKTEIVYIDTTKCFAYQNEYYNVNGCFDKDSAAVIVESRDSLDIIPVIVPKHRFLWWRWGQKGVNLNIINKNPYSKIIYSKYIEIL